MVRCDFVLLLLVSNAVICQSVLPTYKRSLLNDKYYNNSAVYSPSVPLILSGLGTSFSRSVSTFNLFRVVVVVFLVFSLSRSLCL